MIRLVRGCVVALIVVLAVPMVATPANADVYRYWTYWSGQDGGWQFSNRGPSGNVHDGDVIGWRFAVSQGTTSAPKPRATSTALCSNGVTVVIDYGVSDDAPPGERPPSGSPRAFCADDSDSYDGYRATDEHASLRVRSDGLVCGIDGYPKQECAPIVSSAPAPSTKPTTLKPHRRATTAVTSKTHTPSSSTTDDRAGSPSSAATPGAVIAQGGGAAAPTPTPTLNISDVAPAAASKHDDGGVPLALMTGVAIALVLGGVAFWRYRAGPR